MLKPILFCLGLFFTVEAVREKQELPSFILTLIAMTMVFLASAITP